MRAASTTSACPRTTPRTRRDCQRQGYRAYKIHPYFAWDPATRRPTLPKPAPVDWDIEICRAVRDAVGDDMVLMFDPWGAYYSYADALRVGRELERLGFYWYEHPMPEHRVEQYVKLADELDDPDLLTGDRRRRDLHPGRLDSAPRVGHQSHRCAARRHHRRR